LFKLKVNQIEIPSWHLIKGGKMRKLIYSTSLSLDGYIESAAGDLSWGMPDEELHRHFNDFERETDTVLYGRLMYELMADFWPTADQDPSMPDYIIEYAQIWKPKSKVVFSSTLGSVDWNSRLVRGDAVAEVVRLKALPGDGFLGVGGLQLASALASAGLIDEYRLYYVPILLGSGKAAFSLIQKSIKLKVVETREFSSGTTLLRCVPTILP
jgi:dihydrofolate reductase